MIVLTHLNNFAGRGKSRLATLYSMGVSDAPYDDIFTWTKIASRTSSMRNFALLVELDRLQQLIPI